MFATPKVLIVDEGIWDVSVLTPLLKSWYEVSTAGSRDEALDLLESDPFDLAFVQVAPDKGGDATLQALREADPSMAVLAVTEPEEHRALEIAQAAGADDVLCLPVRETELRARIESQYRLRSALRALRKREDHTRVMLELTQTLASSLEFEAILFEVAHRIAEVVRVDRCSIILTGGDSEKGYVVASSEDPLVRDLPIDLSKYPEVQKVLSDGRALVIDVATDPLLDNVRSQIPQDGQTTNALFPIVFETGPMGVLFLRFRVGRNELSDDELALCQTVANATAISLRNARIVSALRDEQARISHARSEAERKVESLKHYADFFESSADGMLVVDPHGSVLYANPSMASLTGRSIDELCQLKLDDLVVDEERVFTARLRAEFTRGAFPRGPDLRFKGPGGEPVTLSVSASATLQVAQGVLLILRDVTSARATEAELRRTKEFLEGLINHSVDAIIASDMQGRILLFNPAAERILGYDASEVLGKPIIANMYPKGLAREIMLRLRSESFGGPGRLEQSRAAILGKDGTEVPISMTGAMIYEEGTPRATFGIFTDLRQMLEMEHDLARARLELMEREREAIAAQLAGAAAHELNQPLTSILASVALLQRKVELRAETAQVVEAIMSETDRMARIVKKIGKITHYETKTYVGSTQIMDLDRAVGSEGSSDTVAVPELLAFADEDTDASIAVPAEVLALAEAEREESFAARISGESPQEAQAADDAHGADAGIREGAEDSE